MGAGLLAILAKTRDVQRAHGGQMADLSARGTPGLQETSEICLFFLHKVKVVLLAPSLTDVLGFQSHVLLIDELCAAVLRSRFALSACC